MSTKSSLKPILLFILFGSPLWIYGIYQAFFRIENKSQTYFQHANLNFVGRVSYTKEISHGAGYLCLDLDSTAIRHYNPSDTLSKYFCIIRDNKAILVIDGISTFEIGDIFIVKNDSSFQYNSRMDSLKWKNKLILVDWIDSPKSIDLCK